MKKSLTVISHAVKNMTEVMDRLEKACEEIDVGTNSTIPVERLENYVRDHLNECAARLMVVMEPLKIVITNLEDGYLEMVDVPNHPKNAVIWSCWYIVS
jgi:glutamyl/glutaminyl-tRNA synthetase